MILICDALKMSRGGLSHFPSKKPNHFLNIEQEFHHEINQLHSACRAAALLQMCISRTKVIIHKSCDEIVYKREYDIWAAFGHWAIYSS